MAIVEAHNLIKVYPMGATKVHALRGLNLTIQAGEFTSVMGPSGSGKSTLLNLVGCLDTPTEGVVVLDGVNVTGARRSRLPAIRREKVGFVFQQFNLLNHLTALENVMLPLRYSEVGGAFDPRGPGGSDETPALGDVWRRAAAGGGGAGAGQSSGHRPG